MLRIATYNMHGGIGRDGRLDIERTLQVLEEIDADIIALQEFADLRDGDGALLARFAAETGTRAMAAPTLFRDGDAYGNLLLSRLPTLEWESHDLSVAGAEPRSAIVALVSLGGLRVRVVATHLGLRRRERQEQGQRLIALLDSGSADCDIVLGDINEWRRGAEPLGSLEQRLGPAPAPRSFPSGRPLFALDRIWVSPPQRLHSIDVHRTPASRQASDHLPVIALVDLLTADRASG